MSVSSQARRRAGGDTQAYRPWLTTATICLGFFLGMLDTTAANFALPDISADFGVGIDTLQWIIDGYNVSFAATLLAGGTLGDSLGRRRMFECGVLVFLVGSILCASAQGPSVLIGGRLFQGAGSGLLLPQSVALLAIAFPEERRRNSALAVWSVVGGVGLAAGPSLGGAMIEAFGWRSLFILNIPVCAVALGLTRIYVSDVDGHRGGRLDVLGQVLGALCLSATAMAIVEYRWVRVHPSVWLALVVGAISTFLGLVRHIGRAPTPIVPPRILRQGRLLPASLGAACMTFGMYGMFMLIPVSFTAVRDASTLEAGILMLPIPLAYIALSPLAGRLSSRYGPRLPMIAGTAAMGTGMLLLALVGPQESSLVVAGCFTVIGVGLGLNTGPVMSLAVWSIEPHLVGAASGIANTARMMGASLGVAVQGAILHHFVETSAAAHNYATGFRTALVAGGAIELVGLLLAIRYASRPSTADANT